MADTGESNINENAERAEQPGYRYNLDSLDDYIATTEEVAGEGRLDEAVELMREGVQRYPESATGRYNLGVALYLRVKKDRERLELWENLADDEQLAEEAIGALEEAILTDPGFIEAYNNLATLYAVMGRKQQALATWEKSLSLDPNQPEVLADVEMYKEGLSPDDEDLEARELMKNNRKTDQDL